MTLARLEPVRIARPGVLALPLLRYAPHRVLPRSPTARHIAFLSGPRRSQIAGRMRTNETTVLLGSRVALVPYRPEHVEVRCLAQAVADVIDLPSLDVRSGAPSRYGIRAALDRPRARDAAVLAPRRRQCARLRRSADRQSSLSSCSLARLTIDRRGPGAWSATSTSSSRAILTTTLRAPNGPSLH